MRILITSLDFSTLTGMPMYIYTLGKEMVRQGHEVVVHAPKMGGEIFNRAKTAGMKMDANPSGEFDGQIVQEGKSYNINHKFSSTPAISYIHSKNPIDEPLRASNVIAFYAPREEVKDRWLPMCGKVKIVPIPVDFERFKPTQAADDGKYKIIVPATVDFLRLPMYLNLKERAEADPLIEVRQFGDNHGSLNHVKLPDNFTLHGAVNDIEKEMAWADEVAGIYMGTVTLEAMAMGKITSVYDEFGNYYIARRPDDFFDYYNPERIAKEFIKEFEI